MTYRIGVDIGGTFTDFTVVDDKGSVTLWKEDSTPDDLPRGIFKGLEAVSAELSVDLETMLDQTTLFVHGSTVATNTVIERDGPTTGLLCTAGFRDVLYFRNAFKPERFNMHLDHPGQLVDRWLRIGVPERMTYDGSVHTPLDEDSVREAAAHFRQAGVGAVAVAFLWSVINPDHERRAAEILRDELPDATVIVASDVMSEIREWQRTSAAVLSAYVLPRISNYLRSFEQRLEKSGYSRTLQIMQSNGGCASVPELLRRPVYALASGPAAAPAAALFHARGSGEPENLISCDMGGTSFDVCLTRGGKPTMSRDLTVVDQPVGVPAVEVNSIGAGGGSIGWVDNGGAVRVGPRSAGAWPGPACYGNGGKEPTVTDANVVLGLLSPQAFLGGRRTLREDLAREALSKHIAEPLGLGVEDAAAGIIAVVDQNMVAGIRAVSIERGIDPRRFTFVSGGGAGGLHAARLAKQLDMKRVLVPGEASTFCAFGMTVSDVRHDHARSFHALSNNASTGSLDEIFEELENEARTRLQADGFASEHISLERYVDARYPNQVHELTIPIKTADTYTSNDLIEVERTFHSEHEARFTYSLSDSAVEFLHWRVTAIGRLPVADEFTTGGDSDGAPGDALIGKREVYDPELRESISADIYDANLLSEGESLEGPAIIQSPITTILINRGDVASVGAGGSFSIEVGARVPTPQV